MRTPKQIREELVLLREEHDRKLRKLQKEYERQRGELNLELREATAVAWIAVYETEKGIGQVAALSMSPETLVGAGPMPDSMEPERFCRTSSCTWLQGDQDRREGQDRVDRAW